MVSEKNNSAKMSLDRLLREDLAQFEVPTEIISGLRDKILEFFQRPEKQPYGAAIMTAAASMAADQARKDKKPQEGGSVPEII